MPDTLLAAEAFTLADRQLCERTAALYYGLARGHDEADPDAVRADAWANLAARIQRVLVGEYVIFTKDHARLVQARHIDVLRAPLEAGTKELSRALSRLGVLVLQASGGQLSQLHGGRP